jgi:hypothetical protein
MNKKFKKMRKLGWVTNTFLVYLDVYSCKHSLDLWKLGFLKGLIKLNKITILTNLGFQPWNCKICMWYPYPEYMCTVLNDILVGNYFLDMLRDHSRQQIYIPRRLLELKTDVFYLVILWQKTSLSSCNQCKVVNTVSKLQM